MYLMKAFALIGFTLSLRFHSIPAQEGSHIRPLGDEETQLDGDDSRQLKFVDLSGLGPDQGFVELDVLEVQVLQNLPKWTIYNSRTGGSEGHFVGESQDGMIMLSLLRSTSESTGMVVTTGTIQDRANHMWYDIKPNHLGQDTVLEVDEMDIPPSGEPKELSFWERVSSIDIRQLGVSLSTSLRYNLGYIQENTDTTIDVMILWTHDAECSKSSLPSGCTLDSTTLANMEAAVDLLISEANTIFGQNSLTGVAFNLAHKQRESTGYVTTDASDLLGQMRWGTNNLGYIGDLRYAIAKRKAQVQSICWN